MTKMKVDAITSFASGRLTYELRALFLYSSLMLDDSFKLRKHNFV